MAHWFHRNPFKATNPQSFDVRKISMKSDFNKIISDLRTARNALLSLFNNQTASPDKMEEASTQYFALIQGLFNVPVSQSQDQQSTSQEDASTENKEAKKDDKQKSARQLRKRSSPNQRFRIGGAKMSQTELATVQFLFLDRLSFKAPAGASTTLKTFFQFKWTQTLFVGKSPTAENNAEFDFINMGVNIALWYTKHAAKLAAQAEINMEDAKEIHTSLRKAAGIFKEFKDNHVGRLSNPPEKCSDLDPNVLECYIMCCQAEAQEVTIARAVEKKHKARLIAGLANETSKYFQMADDHLKSHDQEIVGKWRKYLQLKEAFYKSYALCYYGEALLADEKCGDSIRCLQDSTEHLEKTSSLCKQYISTKGAGSTIRPHEHEFYRNFEKNLHRKFEKSKSENGFIYHQKVPAVPPSMNLQATHGLVDPTPYSAPSTSDRWTSAIYTGYSISKNVKEDKKNAKPKDGEVQPIKEPDIKVTKDNGCSIS